MAALAPPVQVVPSGAPPFVQVSSGAPPFVAVSGNAPPITIVASGAPPITLLNDDGSVWSAVAPPGPGAGMLTGETDGFATDFRWSVDAERVAVKTAGVVVPSTLDTFYRNDSIALKMVYDATGALVWVPHNIVQSSESLQSWWVISNVTAPTATFLQTTATANVFHRMSYSISGPSGNYTYTMDVSAGGYSKIGIYPANTPIGEVAFDLSTGTIIYQNTPGWTASIVPSPVFGAGVYRITVTAAVLSPGFQVFILNPTYTTGIVSGVWTADGTSGINVFRQQLNRGDTACPYLKTTTANRSALAIDYDPVTHASRGLLIEQAVTNLLLNSAALSTQSVTVSAITYTLSFFGTGTVALSGTSTAGPLVGTGANTRVSLTFTPTAGTLTLTVTGTVNYGQLESGTFPTSVIPTGVAAITRVGDNYTFLLSAIPALGSAYSIYCRFSTPFTTSARYPVVVTDGTTAEFAGFLVNTTLRLGVTDGSVAVGAIVGPTLVASASTGAAERIKLNDCAMSVGGAAVGTDITVTLPTVTEVRFGGTGSNVASTTYLNMERLSIVPRGWSDAELQARSPT